MEQKLETEQMFEELYARVAAFMQLERVGLASDIDGTLSPIVTIPSEARVLPESREALRLLQQNGRFEVIALVTGRPPLQAHSMVGLTDMLYLGNHGLEALLPGAEQPAPVISAQPYIVAIATALEEIKTGLQQLVSPRETDSSDWLEKVLFENKGVTASIHYRLTPDPEYARQVILELANTYAAKKGLWVKEGRMVVELRPPLEINKGTALADLVKLYRLDGLIFMGDDLTDIDGFRSLKLLEESGIIREEGQTAPFQAIAIGVTSPEMDPSLALSSDYLLPGVEGVARFLQWLSTLK
ncbi:MAG TPA: trehalose-phosphatase [Chloroflexia bacterium]|nr:trehalose-phosphatase [Chloroflexia bacterium]